MSADKKETQPVSTPVNTPVTRPHRPGRNDACHCGSGKKYKKCHLEEDEAEDRKFHQQEVAKAQEAAEAAAAEAATDEKPVHAKQKRSNYSEPAHAQSTFTNRAMFMRKVGSS